MPKDKSERRSQAIQAVHKAAPLGVVFSPREAAKIADAVLAVPPAEPHSDTLAEQQMGAVLAELAPDDPATTTSEQILLAQRIIDRLAAGSS